MPAEPQPTAPPSPLVSLEQALQAQLAGCDARSDDFGCAIACYNLGTLCAEERRWEAAHRHFIRGLLLARRVGDLHLQGSCLLRQSQICLAHERFDDARGHAEAALALFAGLDAAPERAEAQRVLGVVFRETGRVALAEARLRSAVELAAGAGARRVEAESCRELARLHQMMHRDLEARRLLARARRLYAALGETPGLDAVDRLERELGAA